MPPTPTEPEKNLDLLAFVHYAYAALLGLAGLLPLGWAVFGSLLVAGTAASFGDTSAREKGWFVFGVSAAISAVLLGLAIGNVYAARCLNRRRARPVILAMSALNAVLVPVGTILAAVTFSVLTKAASRSLFSSPRRDRQLVISKPSTDSLH